jgi:hypothetical protein
VAQAWEDVEVRRGRRSFEEGLTLRRRHDLVAIAVEHEQRRAQLADAPQVG